jgi:hypothetical protein
MRSAQSWETTNGGSPSQVYAIMECHPVSFPQVGGIIMKVRLTVATPDICFALPIAACCLAFLYALTTPAFGGCRSVGCKQDCKNSLRWCYNGGGQVCAQYGQPVCFGDADHPNMCTSSPDGGTCNNPVNNVAIQFYDTCANECGADVPTPGSVSTSCTTFQSNQPAKNLNQCKQVGS